MVQFKKLTTTLPGGTNSYTFTDALINDASVIEVYTDNDDVYPVNLEQHGNSIDITLSDHADAVGVALTINNVITYEPTDISGLENEIQTVSDNLSGLSEAVNELSDNVDNIEGDVSTLGTMVTDLETSKQDVLTAGENITIENNVISSTGGSSQEIYDNTERVIGTWFGKTLYRKVIVLTTNIQFPYLAWLDIFTNDELIDITNARLINVPTTYTAERDAFFPIASYCTINKHINIMHFRSNYNIALKPNTKIMIEYTKAGD